ncbi:hypothetical protein H5410_005286 [Solanum commersonii]|uniref:Ubiquitin-like protease family profile domain-containing protein n=1 Tax=Solanum commersonii TaxID=4109 RepID=A0A9J6A759_SOLCO|nr:hypothetical protein H5410_005286 [Solanum commersonii]
MSVIASFVLIETKKVSEDMFIVKINSTVLHFEVKKFAAVTGLKCRLLSDFVSDPSIPNRLIQKYFGEMNKVPKLDFLNKFKEAKFFEPEDRFKIGVLYFISLQTTIPTLYFDLVEIGQYVNYPWGTECFRLTLKACSHKLRNSPTSFKFSEFHLALQVWFYECCHSFDNTVAIHVANGTPRIFNWKRSNEIIFFEDLMNIIFRTYDNQVDNIEKQWRDSNYDMRFISSDHDVGQCIRGFKLLASISWDRVDDVIIPVNVSTAFHWFLVVFRINFRCLHVYDSKRGGALHNENINIVVDKLATMIPLFLTSTKFYGKRLDLDCGMYTCLFVEYISNRVFNIRSIDINSKYHRQSESEVTGTVASKFDGPRIAKEHALDTSNYPTPRPRRSNLK